MFDYCMKKIFISKEKKNSILLSFYMVLIFLYYLISPLRPILFIFFTCYLFSIAKCRKDIIIFSFMIFLLSLVIQLVNFSLHHFLFFILIGPCFAYWLYRSVFDIKIIKRTFFFVQLILFLLYLKGRTFVNVFAGLSENYVSILMIGNVILIACIELRQQEKISLSPSLFGLVLSLLTYGRSGILCAFLLFLIVCYLRFLLLSKIEKGIIFSLTCLLVVFVFLKYYDLLIDFFNNVELFTKFQERGLKSPSRGILIDEYLNHLNYNTILLGYKFDNNPWFIHYGLNPHNSYIRFHYTIGFSAIIVFVFLFFNICKLYRRKHTILIAMLFIMMIRAFTDSFLFLGFYDFLVFYIFLIGGDFKSKYSITSICAVNQKK